MNAIPGLDQRRVAKVSAWRRGPRAKVLGFQTTCNTTRSHQPSPMSVPSSTAFDILDEWLAMRDERLHVGEDPDEPGGHCTEMPAPESHQKNPSVAYVGEGNRIITSGRHRRAVGHPQHRLRLVKSEVSGA